MEVHNAANPESPWDPEATRGWLATKDLPWSLWLVRAGDKAVAAYLVEVQPERSAEIELAVLPEYREKALYSRLYDHAEGLLRDAEKVLTFARSNESELLALLEARGYHEDARERFWSLPLPPLAGRLRREHAEALRQMAEAGIQVTTLAADPHPDKLRELHAVHAEASADVPSSVARPPLSWAVFEAWLARPGVSPERIWIARAGERIVGFSALSYPPHGHVETDFTGVARSWRGRGVGRAVKLASLVQALDLGVERVGTDNDSRNAPILRLNQGLGYEVAYEVVKLLRTSSSPDARPG